MVEKCPDSPLRRAGLRFVCLASVFVCLLLAPACNNGSLLDSDGDGVINTQDAFPNDSREWYDADGDGIGDNADLDDDNDGIADVLDGPVINQALIEKLTRIDASRDAYPKFTGNGVPDVEELTARLSDTHAGGNMNLFQFDPTQQSDFFPVMADQPVSPATVGTMEVGNLLGDELDNTLQQADTNSNGIPDAQETDIDSDGVPDYLDAFPRDATESNDTDGDGAGDNTDCNDDGPGTTFAAAASCIPDTGAPAGSEPVILIRFDDASGPIARCPIDGDVDGIVDDLGVNPPDDPLDPGFIIVTTCLDFSTPCLPVNLPTVCQDLLPLGDFDGDTIPNNTDPDMDGDGVANNLDRDFRKDGISDPVDIDRGLPERPDFFCPSDLARCDLAPDAIDDDADNDGCPDPPRPAGDPRHIPACVDAPLATAGGGDAFPHDPKETIDTDNDGVGDNADNCPFDPTNTCGLYGPDADFDGDTIPNSTDPDIDGDGVPNVQDRFPWNPNETHDNDLDGIGDNADPDDDNDGLPDLLEGFPPSVELLLGSGTTVSTERLRCELNCACSGSTPDCTEPGFICQPPASPICRLGTNPVFPDSDLDGENDGDEWKRLNEWKSINIPSGQQTTPIFIQPGNDIPLLTGKQTYPLLDPDTDGDGILDGSDVSPYGGNTGLPDTDADGLIDVVEQCDPVTPPLCLASSPVPYGTSVSSNDTDGDGLPDPNEVAFDLDGNGAFNDPGDLNTLSYQEVFAFADTAQDTCFNTPGLCTPELQACAALLPPICVPEANAGRLCPAVRTPCQQLVLVERFDPANPDAPLPAAPTMLNPLLDDTDGDGLTDGEELAGRKVNGLTFRTNPLLDDTDGDLWPDAIDNCGSIPNLTQSDSDFDGIGDSCDPSFTLLTNTSADFDHDGLSDVEEIQPRPRTPSWLNRTYPSSPALDDTDNDGVLDIFDICPLLEAANPEHSSVSTNNSDVSDSDGDGTPDSTDGCVCEPGNVCTQPVIDPADTDSDGTPDEMENFGLRPGGFQTDPANPDSDCDGVNDTADNCPCTANPDQSDSNGNHVGSACEIAFGETCKITLACP